MSGSHIGRTLMLQGTSSSVGKSFLVTALCRLYARRGLRVAPFKSQNMALNAAVTLGGEIGRAQAVQAEAAGVEPIPAMNPILLKAEGDGRCQVILMGRPFGSMAATEYRQRRAELWPEVCLALDKLRRSFDLVIIEGAGSPAEVNLQEGEIVNMSVAAAADAPVLLVGDVDRGGVFAALLGTLDLLPPGSRARIRGLVVNRFRGDPALFAGGVRFLEARSGLPVLGVVPRLDVRLPAEDSLEVQATETGAADPAVDVAVVRLDRISNFDELQALAGERGVRVRLVRSAGELGQPDLVILPGTKTTSADLASIRASGLAAAIVDARHRGSAVLGICGGYQMLGLAIDDPDGIESGHRSIPGLGLLPVETRFEPTKLTELRSGVVLGGPGLLADAAGTEVHGYEIRMGRVTAADRPWLDLGEHVEGCASADGWVLGTSVHGLLERGPLRRRLVELLAARAGRALPPARLPDDPFERMADAVERSLDIRLVDHLVGIRN